MSYLESALTSQDLRFQAGLAEARALYHFGESGALFEKRVLHIMQGFLPGAYTARGVLLDDADGVTKQLDVGVFPSSIPPLVSQLPIGSITAVGEVKLRLREQESIVATAEKLAEAASLRGRTMAVPFFVLAGELEREMDWAAKLVATLAGVSPVWPAVFSFDRDKTVSVLHVSATSALRAETADGQLLDGVISVKEDQLSPSAMLYLWLWAAIHADDPVHGMDFRYMRESIGTLSERSSGLTVQYRPGGDGPVVKVKGVVLRLPEDQSGVAAPVPVSAPRTEAGRVVTTDRGPVAPPTGQHRLMLISLGAWVDEPDTWDESAWGGSAQATRTGYGYRSGMTDTELLDAARLFWRWSPDSETWRGIEYAVVVHGGVTRAVLRIDRVIGPFWGRWGFQGRVVKDPVVVEALVGRQVPPRQNPVTTIAL